MKQYKVYLVNVLITILILTLFSAGQAFASTACFPDTNGHWAETFICWMKDNSITTGYNDGTYKPENGVTRAEMSVFLQKIYNHAASNAQTVANTAETNAETTAASLANTAETNAKAYADTLVNIPPSTGELRFNFGSSEWAHGVLDGDVTVLPGTTLLVSRTNALSSNTIVFTTPALPAVIYDRQTLVAGVEVCYGGDANHYLDILSISVGGTSVEDITDYNQGNGCMTLMFPNPPALSPRNFLTISASIRLSNAGSFAIKSTSVYLAHTETPSGP